MVTDIFLGMVRALVGWLASILPAWNLTMDNQQVQGFVFELTRFNGFIPVAEVLILLTLFFTLQASLHIFKWAKMLINLVRGSGA